MSESRKLLFIGLAPRVLALDPDTGDVVWATELPSSGGIVATIRVEGGRVYAGVAGEVTCLDAADGKVLWHNQLKGFGMHPVTFAADTGGASAAVVVTAASAAVVASAG
ncbi:MAG: PQQ-binding-like beta-propeller repeat protein [Planctomycetes bacterium]|nr:PQQ-binding-like beta-propeller repeat protein [Planctomycetota bacterium]